MTRRCCCRGGCEGAGSFWDLSSFCAMADWSLVRLLRVLSKERWIVDSYRWRRAKGFDLSSALRNWSARSWAEVASVMGRGVGSFCCWLSSLEICRRRLMVFWSSISRRCCSFSWRKISASAAGRRRSCQARWVSRWTRMRSAALAGLKSRVRESSRAWFSAGSSPGRMTGRVAVRPCLRALRRERALPSGVRGPPREGDSPPRRGGRGEESELGAGIADLRLRS